MDKTGIFRYFTKPAKSNQNSQSASSTSTCNQIPLNANCVNKESTIPKSVEQQSNETMQDSTEHSLSHSTPNDLGNLSEGPRQPKLNSFPFSVFGDAKRKFKSKYYKEFPFIEYSISTNSIFCFCCHQFSASTGKSEESFSKTGFRNWKHIGDKLTKHLSSNEHAKCMDRWINYKKTVTSGSVSSLLSSVYKNRSK